MQMNTKNNVYIRGRLYDVFIFSWLTHTTAVLGGVVSPMIYEPLSYILYYSPAFSPRYFIKRAYLIFKSLSQCQTMLHRPGATRHFHRFHVVATRSL